MQALELKVLPPIVALLVAAAMWGISLSTSRFEIAGMTRYIAVFTIVVVGVAFAASGVLAFRRARTTLDPAKPDDATSLVSSGVFRLTRNPMYLGVSIVLLAWALFLSSAWAFLGPVAFVLYISRFQIAPEERALAKRFGPAFAEYQTRVRRWL